MNYTKPLPRSEYEKRLSELAGKCAFCKETPSGLLIKEYKYWSWQFSLFPYHRQHTLIILKAHRIQFGETTDEEALELRDIMKEVEHQYRKSGLVNKDSEDRNQLFIGWRSRAENATKPEVAHLHLHVYPDFEGSLKDTLHDDAHLADTSKLRKSYTI